MPTILITGASKGIGLEFTRQYAKFGWHVIPTYRGEMPETLASLQQEYPEVTPEHLDVDDLHYIDALATRLAGKPIDVLLNNAGRMGGPGGPQAQTGESFGTLDYELLDAYIHTNVRAPIRMAEAFLENLQLGVEKKIITISSGAGSFGMPATLPGLYWYKASKSAVNMIMRNLARDLKEQGITVVNFHPGLVITERLAKMREKLVAMSGQEKPYELDEAVKNMMSVIAELRIEDSGRFIKNTGEDMPW